MTVWGQKKDALKPHLKFAFFCLNNLYAEKQNQNIFYDNREKENSQTDIHEDERIELFETFFAMSEKKGIDYEKEIRKHEISDKRMVKKAF